ncbi:lysophospholipid acyltransferase family protein [candidate division KSB1 bacterium]|nr:lysophospholipid acyltransferase family protein [candidate division KSB1 bacterium]
MNPKIKRIRHFFEYLFFLVMGIVARLLPRRLALFVGARFGDLGFYCIPIRKKVTLENLRRAFPEKSEKEIKRIARGTYRNLGINAIEHLRFAGMTRQGLLKLVRFQDEHLIIEALKAGKGIVFAGGHFGNWEYMGCAIGAAGYPVSFVIADIHNRYLDNMINAHRKKMGINLIPKGMAIRGMLRTLRENGSVAMLMDQDAGQSGVFVDFMGQPSSTPKGPASFALKTGAAILFIVPIRQQDTSIHIMIEKIDHGHLVGASESNIKELTQRCTTLLEKYVRAYPDQWFWMHRRWKTKPADADASKPKNTSLPK